MSDPTLKATICANCGTPAAPGEGFCRNCGNQLVMPTVAAPPAFQGAPAPTMTAPPPAAPHYQPPVSVAPPRKRRSKFMMGCLVIIGLGVAALGAGGVYVWYKTSYTPPVRTQPDIPQRAAGTLTEFPVDNDKSKPSEPGTVQTESLGGALAKNETSSGTKLPPGITKTSLGKGATTMTSSTYKPKLPSGQIPVGTTGDVYICVLTAIPGQPGFVDGLVTSVKTTTSGTVTSVTVQSPKGATYAGSHIVSSQGNIYVLSKQGSDIIIILYGADPSSKETVDRLAQNVGNGEGLIDYPSVKESLWTLPAKTPNELTLIEINTMTGAQIESSLGSGDLPSEMRPFIPERLTGARYNDASKQEWVVMNLQYGSNFQAWRTWLLARSALGLGGGETTTVRDVDGIYLNQEGKRIMLFQKGPYLIFMSGPAGAPVDRFVTLGNQIQV
ncbi:MAG TPA: zinc ribbon domain-containing protein [Pyrinomonadaceae bacterium]|nr:zinc ribbon domain-containing protein [Pyrinomonadaceae bacterium]